MSDRKEAQKVNTFPMMEMNQSRTQMLASMKQDSPVSSRPPFPKKLLLISTFTLQYSGFRKTILGIYILVIIFVVATLITLITIAPTKDIEFSLG